MKNIFNSIILLTLPSFIFAMVNPHSENYDLNSDDTYGFLSDITSETESDCENLDKIARKGNSTSCNLQPDIESELNVNMPSDLDCIRRLQSTEKLPKNISSNGKVTKKPNFKSKPIKASLFTPAMLGGYDHAQANARTNYLFKLAEESGALLCPVQRCIRHDKPFATKYNLKEHLKTHSKEYPYLCPYCPTLKQYSNSMSHHIAQKHPNEVHKYCILDL